jgi:hypothetical protein
MVYAALEWSGEKLYRRILHRKYDDNNDDESDDDGGDDVDHDDKMMIA